MAHAIELSAYVRTNPENGLFARLSRALAAYREYATTRDELCALGDRELADLGIARDNIRSVARQAALGL